MLSMFVAPTPLSLPHYQESQNILPIAYDYPPMATLEALADSPIESLLGRTESLCIAFSEASQ